MAQHMSIASRIAKGSAVSVAALAAALDLVDDGVLLLGPNLEVLAVNARATELLGRPAPRGSFLTDVLPPTSAARLRATVRMLESTSSTQVTMLLDRSNGSKANLELSFHPSAAGELETIAILRPARGAFAAQLEPGSADRDYLTGLPTRAALAARLQEVEAQARKTGNPYAILFIDLDAFKTLNDDRGHAAGDCVLAVVAERLKTAVRPGDLVARYGGDEFVIVVDDITAPQLARLARRLRTMLAAPLEFGGQWISATASIGRAFGDRMRPASEVLDEADRAMYRAKAARRKRHPR